MDLPISLQDITYAENYLAQGDLGFHHFDRGGAGGDHRHLGR